MKTQLMLYDLNIIFLILITFGLLILVIFVSYLVYLADDNTKASANYVSHGESSDWFRIKLPASKGHILQPGYSYSNRNSALCKSCNNDLTQGYIKSCIKCRHVWHKDCDTHAICDSNLHNN